jgi:hypothetical protein
MGMDRAIFHKTKADARVGPEARVTPKAKRERPRFGPTFATNADNLRVIVERAPESRGAPLGAANLRRPGYTDVEHWQKGVRIMDMSASFEASEQFLIEVMRVAFAKPLHAVEDKVAALEERLATEERENSELRASIAELKGQVAGLEELQVALEVKLARTVRGSGDGASLPASIVKPRARAKAPAKRKRPPAEPAVHP